MNPEGTDMHDVVIIGSGPAGWTAALYTARAGLRPLVLCGRVAGGALMTTTEVENFPGFAQGVLGPELMDQMRTQAERFGALSVEQDAVAVDLGGTIKRITDGTGRTYAARTVIVATGSRYKTLGLPRESDLSGRGVSWCATCDGFFFKGQDLVVVGGGDTALEEATFLTRYARSVTVVHRRDTLRASQVMQDRARRDSRISFLWDQEVVTLLGEKALTGVTLRHCITGRRTLLRTRGLFIAIGHDPRSELFAGELERDASGYLLVQSPTTLTGVPGVFACGDVVDHRYRQAVTAAGSGCAAALDAERHLSALRDGEAQAAPGTAPSQQPPATGAAGAPAVGAAVTAGAPPGP